jgi:hypothetical protein
MPPNAPHSGYSREAASFNNWFELEGGDNEDE